LSTSILSALCFVQLAVEMREGEMAAFDALLGGGLAHWRGSVDPLMLALTRFGGWRSLTLVTAALVALLAMRGRPKQATYLVLGAGGPLLLNWALKLLFHRARPDSSVLYLVAAPTSFSFPSGHAMCSAGVLASIAVVTQTLGWRRAWAHLLGALCLVLAAGVGISRVYLGVHFASDVMGGQLAAAAWVGAQAGGVYTQSLPRGSGVPESPS
jgi:undecaprenyl-diphosphatase